MNDLLSPAVHAASHPDAPAIVVAESGETTTYLQLEDRSRRFANALRARAVAVGDHIAILLENNRSFLEVTWAAQRAGLHYTTVNCHLLAHEVQYILDDCGAVALVTSGSMSSVLADLDLARIGVRVTTDGAMSGFERYDEMLAVASDAPVADEQEGREMLYSSGTTGRPKGVRKPLPGTHLGDPLAAPGQIALAQARRGIGPDTVLLTPGPLYHAAPLMAALASHRLGGSVLVMNRFDAEETLRLIERHRVTHAQFVPTMFIRMLRLPTEVRSRYDLSSLRLVQHGAAPCPIAVKRQMIDWLGPIIVEYYGGTEEIGWSSITSGEWLLHPGSVGRPVQECHVLDDDGRELPPGGTGLIFFEGGREFEYHNDADKTRSITNGHGWRTLGDIGYLDDDGYLYLTDRQANMIISGGVNVYPQEAENVLAAHPAVADVAVIGIPDDDLGEVAKAFVELVDGETAGAAQAAALLDHCREHLARYKCPRSIEFVADLPRAPNGKLYKHQLGRGEDPARRLA